MSYFTVIAGKFEDTEMNIKYLDEFEYLDNAIKAYDKCKEYHWRYIIYKGRYLDVHIDDFDPF